MTRWLLMSITLLALFTACPETWGKEGLMDKAMEKDTQDAMKKHRRPPGCPMSDEKWAELCDRIGDRHISSQCSEKCVEAEEP